MSSIRVKVSQGVVRGCEEDLPDGRKFQRFSGIPYAKPPIGELRFRSPQKLLKFDEPEIDGTKEGDACFHRSDFLGKVIGSEDCLYLNVYVPSKPKSGKKLPVMIWIHGGGFSFDSASIQWYSPEYLLMEDVIVVTINYRLHVLGFMSLPSMGISGNAGLKDQQMAIEWVYENISNFNGDPENICLFGESAGAASVHLQILNPRTRKLIKSAICQSGCALGDWVVQRDGVGVTRKLAKILGCKSDDDQEIYKTLMATSAEDLFRYKTKPQDRDERRRNLNFTFKPMIEQESDDAFMTKYPMALIREQAGQINIPIIFGTNVKDGNIMVASYRHTAHLFNNDPVSFVPRSVNIDPQSEAAKKLGEEVKHFYTGGKPIGEETIPEFIDFMTDFHFLVPQTIANEAHARYNPKCKQYLNEFWFDGELNHYKKILAMNDYPGAGHGDEVTYLFNQRLLSAEIDVGSRTDKMRNLMCKLWTNFAKFGDPTPENENPLSFRWTPMELPTNDRTDLDYLLIDDETRMACNLNKNRLDFWRGIYRKWNTSFVSKL